MRRAVRLLALAAALAWPGLAVAQSLTVSGLDGGTRTLSAADIAALPRTTAQVREGGKTRAYEGPLLVHVLRAAGTPVGQRLHGEPLRAYLTVAGADGFSAVYSLAEVDQDFHDDVVVLADRVDGAALEAKHRPWRVVSTGDKKGWRAVYQVTRIEVRQAKP